MTKTNSDNERAFFDAVAGGNVSLVQEMVQQDNNLLNAYDYECFGATPITRVCFQDDRSMIGALIELGADVDRRSDWSMGPWSPLHCALFTCNDDLANYLLENGAQLDVHGAAGLARMDDLIRLLDESPERVSEQGGDGCQPLHFAGSNAVADLLLERGADINARCIDHYSTPVQYLSAVNPEAARHLLSKGADADLFSAIMANDLLTIERLTSSNPDILKSRINQQSFPPGPEHDVHNIMTFAIGHDATALHAASKANQPAIIEMLVKAGLDPNIRGAYDDCTALHDAAWNDHVDAANALLDQGADVDLPSGEIHNNSPAGWAIVAGSADVFCLLLDRGATVLEHFVSDAQAAVDGEFRQYKKVPQENYQRILNRLSR